MYCKFGDKISALGTRVFSLEFPKSARKKIQQGVLSEDFEARWITLKKKSYEDLSKMLKLLNEMVQEEKEYRWNKKYPEQNIY